MNTLLLGGTGRLGTSIVNIIKERNYTNFFYPTRNELNFLNKEEVKNYCIENNIKQILHIGGHPMFCKDELDFVNKKNIEGIDYRNNIRNTNIFGCLNIVTICDELQIKLIYTSSEYVFYGDQGLYNEKSGLNPKNLYGLTKGCGEFLVKTLPNYLIIRAPIIRSNKFEHDFGFTDQYCSRLYLTEASELILNYINSEENGIIHICGNRNSLFEIAKQTVPNIKPATMNAQLKNILPLDTSLVSSILNL